MKLDKPRTLLYIHPENDAEETSNLQIDAVFFKLYQAMYCKNVEYGGLTRDSKFILNMGFKGIHTCTGGKCEARSSNRDVAIRANDDDYLYTNTLALHYLACHRAEVPESELKKIEEMLPELDEGFVMPTEDVILEIIQKKESKMPRQTSLDDPVMPTRYQKKAKKEEDEKEEVGEPAAKKLKREEKENEEKKAKGEKKADEKKAERVDRAVMDEMLAVGDMIHAKVMEHAEEHKGHQQGWNIDAKEEEEEEAREGEEKEVAVSN